MQPISLRTGFFALTFVAIASLSGVLTACSKASQSGSTASGNQSQAQNTPATEANGKQDMMHGGSMNHGSGMNHSMAMDLGPADANYDLRFIDAMTPHHQGAVEMAKEALTKSQHPEIKKLAQDIISAQNREINELKQWRQAWYPQAESTPMAHNAQTGQMMPMPQSQMQDMMMKGDLGAADAQFDLRFINAMIPHHESAITMAKDALSKSKRSQIKKLAQDIIASQQKEIDQMKQWRKAWYKQ
ncbi:MAG TPA: DUF305 domain-containing protein [Allocoleopsis sp.]